MAKAPKGAMRQATYGMSGGWFWLALGFAATLYLRFSQARAQSVLDILVDHAFPVAVAVALWSVAGRGLGGILRAAAPAPAPAWIFRLNGWMLATIAAGILIALQAGDDPRGFRNADELSMLLLSMASLGFGWWLLIDVARAILARLARRADIPFFSSGTLAFALGLAAIGWTVWSHRQGLLDQPPFKAGLAALGMALAAGIVLTLLIEVPRALIAHRAGRARAGTANDGLLAARTALAGQLRTRVVGTPAKAALHTSARTEHGRIETPPTVVRRQ